jgi:hypothetical protein
MSAHDPRRDFRLRVVAVRRFFAARRIEGEHGHVVV